MVEGQRRSRPLAATLTLASAAARCAGVTRLADVTGLDRIGVPVFQAIRPGSLSLSVSQGKGLTRQAAMVSALMEAIELDAAERLERPVRVEPLARLPAEMRDLWSFAPRPRLGIRLDPQVERGWMAGRDLLSGRAVDLPFDLVAMDFTASLHADSRPSSAGLASGNTASEALAGAVAELVEHDMMAHWRMLPPRGRRVTGLDLDSADAPLVRRLLTRIAGRGLTVRAWSIGQDHGLPGFHCAIMAAGTRPALPPASGTGCHPDRAIALLRALLEAVQVRITLIAGARDDLVATDYADGPERALELILTTMSVGRAPLDWTRVPDARSHDVAGDLDVLLAAAAARSPLPVLAVELDPPVPGLAVVRAFAPGLSEYDRAWPPALVAETTPVIGLRGAPKRAVIFAGPSLAVTGAVGIEFRPPAVAGDLAALLDDPPAAVGLIDGSFEVAPTVWHKEIIDLIAHGIAVFGAASLGAIRAAELVGSGMVGIGAIFAAYRDGSIARDDAVMVQHAPAELGFRPLTLALVDAEFALLGVDLPAADRRWLQRIVRTRNFRDRDWRSCFTEFAERTGRLPAIDHRVLVRQPSIKQLDALLLLDAVAAVIERRGAAPRPPMTCYYRDLLTRVAPSRL